MNGWALGIFTAATMKAAQKEMYMAQFTKSTFVTVSLPNYVLRRERLMKGTKIMDTKYYMENVSGTHGEQIQLGTCLAETVEALFKASEIMADFHKVDTNMSNLEQVFREWKLTRLIMD